VVVAHIPKWFPGAQPHATGTPPDLDHQARQASAKDDKKPGWLASWQKVGDSINTDILIF